MVDFNNEATIGTPATDVVKISILERRYDVIEAFEHYKKKKFDGIQAPLSIVRARLMSLFLEIQAMLKRKMKPEDYVLLVKGVGADKYDEVMAAFIEINEFVDELRLTRIDNQRVYNSQDVEEENKVKGF